MNRQGYVGRYFVFFQRGEVGSRFLSGKGVSADRRKQLGELIRAHSLRRGVPREIECEGLLLESPAFAVRARWIERGNCVDRIFSHSQRLNHALIRHDRPKEIPKDFRPLRSHQEQPAPDHRNVVSGEDDADGRPGLLGRARAQPVDQSLQD